MFCLSQVSISAGLCHEINKKTISIKVDRAYRAGTKYNLQSLKWYFSGRRSQKHSQKYFKLKEGVDIFLGELKIDKKISVEVWILAPKTPFPAFSWLRPS